MRVINNGLWYCRFYLTVAHFDLYMPGGAGLAIAQYHSDGSGRIHLYVSPADVTRLSDAHSGHSVRWQSHCHRVIVYIRDLQGDKVRVRLTRHHMQGHIGVLYVGLPVSYEQQNTVLVRAQFTNNSVGQVRQLYQKQNIYLYLSSQRLF